MEIAGPTGMIQTDACRWGFFLQNADHDYPERLHAAEELYFVVSGMAEWTREGEASTLRPPGSFIHHASWQPHAMRTVSQPLLAMWGWTGNIDYGQYRIVSSEPDLKRIR